VQRGADVPDLDHDPQSDDADQGERREYAVLQLMCSEVNI